MKLLIIWAFVALTAVHARTAVRQQPLSPRITSLTDKDARQKARSHPAFANAGTRAGLELWRIENFEPVVVPATDVGKFYKGDSYIVLKTTADKRNNLSWDIHYWIGSESSQDESGAAAILTVGLDDKFDGKAVQHRETMGYESQQFLNYFPGGDAHYWIGSESSQDESGAAAILTVGLDDKFDGKAVQHRETMGYESQQFLNYFPGGAVRYLDGGHQSGFNHVETNPGAEKRLFQVKGKKNIRVRQVDPLISSMNKGDCFILDINNDIFVYVGEKSKNVERLKAISMANQIRDQDHNGRGRVEIIDQYSSEVDVQKFFTNLGSGSKDLVPEESAGGDDQTFEKKEESSVILSEVSDSTGKLKITPLPAPFRQEQLKPQETYILDTVSGSIYVWVGKQATQKEKTEAMAKAQQYLTAKNYPSWVHVARIPQGTEPAIFKQYFATWRDVGMSHSRIVRATGDDSYVEETIPKLPTDRYSLYNAVMELEGVMNYRKIRAFTQKDLKENKVYYLIDNNSDDSYFWIGRLVPNTEKVISSLNRYINLMSFSSGRNYTIYRQGEESPRFLAAFPGWDNRMWQKRARRLQRLQANEEMRSNLIPDS